ncbi:MAG: T9SS type A sorting domain-containing protein [Bacteroidetes bacterium]|nr:T9SS type A sorting domain-containing protein [Bacteroidota bacterium]
MILKTIAVCFTLHFALCNSAFAQSWSALGSGMSGNVRTLYADTTDSSLYVGGDFEYAGGLLVHRIARWDGMDWDSLGSGIWNGFVTSIIRYKGDLYVGGAFRNVAGMNATGLARWNGANWDTLGPVLSIDGLGDPTPGAVSNFLIYEDTLYVMGNFLNIGGVYSPYIAKYDGANWYSIPVLDSSEDWGISSAVFYDGELHVGGNFNAGPNMSDLARFDGISWKPIGTGLSGGLTGVGTLHISDTSLIVAGLFYKSSGDPGNNIAAWDGSNWSDMDNGVLPADVREVVLYDDYLYICGQISYLPDATPINRVAKWDGQNWTNAAPPIMINSVDSGTPSCMAIFNNELYLGGYFLTVDGDTMKHIAKYSSGTGWKEAKGQVISIKLFPNPFHESGTITTTLQRDLSFSLFDLLGREVMHIEKRNSNTLHIKRGKLPRGIYIYRIEGNKRVVKTGKLVIQ